MDHSNWREMIRGTAATVTVTVMPWAEYDRTGLLIPVTAFAPDSLFIWPRRHIQSSRCTRLLAPWLRQCTAGRPATHNTRTIAAGHQRRCTRLVDGLQPRDHVTAATTALHWLPVEVRTQYKLCLLVHLALARKAPTYITSLLSLSLHALDQWFYDLPQTMSCSPHDRG